MITSPTVTIYGWGNSSGNVHRLGSGDIASVAIAVKDVNGITQVNRSGHFDSGAVYGFAYKADAEL